MSNKQNLKDQLLLAQTESLANVGSWELNLVKNELTWSGGVFMLLGYKPFEFKVTFNVGVEIIHPDDRQRALNHMQEALESNKPYYIKKRLIGNKNQIKYVVSKAEVIRNKKGKPVKLIGIFKDITDLVLAENENKRHLSDLNERIKEQNCLFNIANLAANHQNINSYLTEVCKIIPTGFQIPEKAQAQIQFKGKKYNSNSQKSSTKSLSVSGTTSNNNKILIAVYYTGKINLPGNKLFLNEEKVLLNTVLKSLILKIDQIEAYNNYELILQSTQEGVYGIDTNGNCIFINKAAQKLLGYKQHEVLGKNMHKLVHYKTIDNKQVSEEKSPIYIAAKKNVSCEVPFDYFFTKSKLSLPVRFSSTPIIENGVNKGAVVVFNDISANLQAQQKLIESEKRFKALVQDGSDLIAVLSESGHYTYVSPTSTRVLGIKPHNFIGKLAFDFIHPEDLERVSNRFLLAFKRKRVNIKPFRFKNNKGEWRWLETVITNKLTDSSINGFITNSTDVTENFKVEEALKSQHARYHELFIKAPSFICILKGPNHVFQMANPPFLKLIARKKIIGKPILQVMPEIKNQGFVELLNKVYYNGQTITGNQTLVQFKDNSTKKLRNAYIDFTYQPQININGQIEGVFVFGNDVTQQVLNLNEIKKSNERYEYVNKATNDAIYEWDVVNDVFTWGNAFKKVFGHNLKNKKFTIANWVKLMHPTDDEQNKEAWQKFLANKTQNHWEKSFRFKKADGSYAYTEEIGNLVRDNEGKPIRMIGVLRDVTERKINENQKILQTQISQIFKNANSLNQSLNETLNYLSNFCHCQAAELWQVSDLNKNLVLSNTYSYQNKFNDFFTSSNLKTLNYGQGLAGKVWKSKKIEIWANLSTNKNFIRAKDAAKNQLNAGFAIPIFANSKVIGVLAFFTTTAKLEDNLIPKIFYNNNEFIGSEIVRKRQEEEMQLLFESSPDIMAVASPKGHFANVNPVFSKLLGYSEKTLTTKPFSYFLHPDDITETISEYDETITGEHQTTNFVNRYRTKQGEYKWISWGSSKIFNDEGYFFAYGRDVTQLKKLQSILDNATKLSRVGAWEVDLIRNKHYWSSITRQIHEVSDTFEPSFDAAFSFYRPDYRKKVELMVNAALTKNKPFDFEAPIITAKGNECWIRAIGQAEVVNNKIIKIFGSFQDINARKQAELRIQSISDNVPGVLFQYLILPNGTDKFQFVSKGAINIWGYTPAEISNDSSLIWKGVKDSDDLVGLISSIQNSAANLSKWSHRFRYFMPNGAVKYLEGVGNPQKLPDGTILWDAIVMDITDKHDLKALAERTARSALIGSWELDLTNQNTDAMYWSPMTRQILEVDENYNPSLTSGFEFYDEKSKTIIQNAVKTLINTGQTYDLELLINTQAKKQKWIRCIGLAEHLNGECVRIFGSFQDINKSKLAELDLARKNQLLETITLIISTLLQVEDWYEALKQVFEATGNTVGVDRVYYFENHKHPDTGLPTCSQRYEWVKNQITPQINNPLFQNIPIETFREFFIPLEKGESLGGIVSQMPDSELKEALIVQDIKSFIVFPILISKQLFGFIGFDDCTTERNWSRTEVSFLQNVTSNLSAAIQRQNAEKEREKTLNEKNTILESIGDAFFAIDKNFVVTYWNKEAENLLGKKREQMLGVNLWDVFQDAVNLPSFKYYNLALETQKIIHFDDYYPTSNQWFEVSAYPSATGLSVYFKDVSIRKVAEEQIRQSNERFERVSQATNDAIWDWNLETNQVYRGEGYQSIFGYEVRNNNQVESNWETKIHPSDRKRVLQSFNQAIINKDTSNWSSEYQYKKADGSFAYVIDRGSIIRNAYGKAIRVVGAITDISHRKVYEESLKALNIKLERHAKELQISNKELEQFAYVASHDLQEPLRMVTSFLTQLEKKYSQNLDEKANQYIHFAVDGAKRMRQIILDLLEFSRVGKYLDEPEPVSLNDILNEVLLLQKKTIAETKASIKIGQLEKVLFQRSPLVQLFQNLIENALKYRKPNTKPKIEVSGKMHENYYAVTVTDNGIGIDKEYFDKIFIIFQRLHYKEEYGGTGMGLAIVKKIIENMGGKILVDSVLDSGSKFTVAIPKSFLV